MKKTYITPNIIMLTISTSNIIAASDYSLNSEVGDGEVASGEILSRRRNSFWDDEEW